MWEGGAGRLLPIPIGGLRRRARFLSFLMSKPTPYLLDVGDDEAARLALLNRIYGPYTESFLNQAGLAPEMNVLDVGCGTGSLTTTLARVTGASKIVGIEPSAGSNSVPPNHHASQNALRPGTEITASPARA